MNAQPLFREIAIQKELFDKTIIISVSSKNVEIKVSEIIEWLERLEKNEQKLVLRRFRFIHLYNEDLLEYLTFLAKIYYRRNYRKDSD